MIALVDESVNLMPSGCQSHILIKKEANDGHDNVLIKIESGHGKNRKRPRKQDKFMIMHAPSKRKCTTWFSGLVPDPACSNHAQIPSSRAVIASKRPNSPSQKEPVKKNQRYQRGKCKHSKRKSSCLTCNPSAMCQHDKWKSNCTVCTPCLLCPHGKWKKKKNCTICFKNVDKPKKKGSFCEHGKRRDTCPKCRPSLLCPHGKWRVVDRRQPHKKYDTITNIEINTKAINTKAH